MICRGFSLLNHYLFLVVFSWLMNEAFNLYIAITYAAHQTSPIHDTEGQWRFYILGWIFPAVLVIILLAIKSDDYYDKRICWFNLGHLWINISPMIAMIVVTIKIF